MRFMELLIKLNACEEACVWAEDKTIEQVVSEVHRGDWLLWLGKKLDLPLNKITLAKSRCAKTVIHLMKDQRSINTIMVAERFGLDECTLDELNIAAASADASADAAADAASTAAATAAASADAYAAAAAADAAYAAAAADAYAASAAAAAADAAYADAYAASSAAAADAKIKNQKETADICREILGQLIINEVNKRLND